MTDVTPAESAGDSTAGVVPALQPDSMKPGGIVRLGRAGRAVLLPLLLSVIPVGINLIWLGVERSGRPLDIDEAGYASFSFNNYVGLSRGGWSGWWHQVVSQPVFAPLGPAAASILHWATGPRVLNAMVVSTVAYGVIVLSTVGLTRRWPASARVVSLTLVVCSPVLINYSRTNNFAELAAAALAGALYFAQRSETFSKTWPAVGWGVFIGLMPLARTMSIAFLPGMILAAFVPIAARRSWSGLGRLALGLVVATSVAATWYYRNFQSVYDYLTSVGYGSRASEYGESTSLLSPQDWYEFLLGNINMLIFAGTAVVLVVGWLIAVAHAVRRGSTSAAAVEETAGRIRAVWRRASSWASTGPVALACAIVALSGMAALMTSRNLGSAFSAPLIVPLSLVASYGLAKVPGRLATIGVPVIVALTVLPAATLMFWPIGSIERETVGLPGDRELVLWDSRGSLQGYIDAGGVPYDVIAEPYSKATGRRWYAASAFLADQMWSLADQQQRAPLVVFAFRHLLVNPNTVILDSLIRYDSAAGVVMMNPDLMGDDPAVVIGQISSLDPAVTMVVTATPGPDEFQPLLPAGVGEQYAERLGFARVAGYTLPDGRKLSVWSRT